MKFAGWSQSHIDNYAGPTPDVVAGLAEDIRAKLESTYCVSEVGFQRHEVRLSDHLVYMSYKVLSCCS